MKRSIAIALWAIVLSLAALAQSKAERVVLKFSADYVRACVNFPNSNTFAGVGAGAANTSHGKAFFSTRAGKPNTTGSNHAFFVRNAGAANPADCCNTFVGVFAGQNNTGGSNSFFGYGAGSTNTSADQNSFFGASSGAATTTGGRNSFFGAGAGFGNSTGSNNAFFGNGVGSINSSGSDNVFLGREAGGSNTTGSDNTLIGAQANVASGNLTHATAIGSEAIASLSNSIYLGRANGADAVRIPGATIIDGSLVVHTLGSAGSANLCLNSADRLAPCSSSRRYKANIVPFRSGLELINKLRPVSFTWKDSGKLDLGLVAEEVAMFEPLLTTTNADGDIEGVKYDRIAVVLLNAAKEQQAQIEAQQKQLLRQQVLLDSLKKLVCKTNPQGDICLQEAKQ